MGMTIHPCDLCGADDHADIAVTAEYLPAPLSVCKACGLVYVRERRSAEEVAASWTDELYPSGHYKPESPWMKSRHVYVANILDEQLPRGGSVCDIGAGVGGFLQQMLWLGWGGFGIEPSKEHCEDIEFKHVPAFCGTIGEYSGDRTFDLVSMLWTLEASADPRAMLQAARHLLKPGGHVCVATGSRILVPFKKPLWCYLGDKTPMDTHPLRFSANTLRAFLASNRFEVVYENRWIDSDIMLMIGKRYQDADLSIDELNRQLGGMWKESTVDDYRAVIDYFERWHADTVKYYPRPEQL